MDMNQLQKYKQIRAKRQAQLGGSQLPDMPVSQTAQLFKNLQQSQDNDERILTERTRDQNVQSRINELNTNGGLGSVNVPVFGNNINALASNNIQLNNESNDYFDRLGRIESTNNYKAYNKGSKAYGKYQFIPSTEKDIAKRLGISIKEARTPAGQEKMVRKLTDLNRTSLVKAGIEPNNKNLWAAHNQGARGAINMIKHNKGNVRNIASNLPGGGPATVANYRSQWDKKWDAAAPVEKQDPVVGLSQNEMDELDKILGPYAFKN